MATFQRVALFFIIIGALNWGCIGLFQFDPIATVFKGSDTFFARAAYTIVGIAGLASIALLWADFPEQKIVHTKKNESSVV